MPAVWLTVRNVGERIDCARAHGAISVGVATGPFSRAQLVEAGADLVVETLEETEALLRVLRP